MNTTDKIMALADKYAFYVPGSTLSDAAREALRAEIDALVRDAEQKHKPLFTEMIAQHPGLAEELAQQDAQAVPQDDVRQWNDGFRAAMNSAASGVRELYINHCFHHGVDGLLERCKRLEQSFICHADSALNAAPTPPAQRVMLTDGELLERLASASPEQLDAWLAAARQSEARKQHVMLTDEELYACGKGLVWPLDEDANNYAHAVIEAYERKNGKEAP